MYLILLQDYIISSVRAPGKGKEITLLYLPTHSHSLSPLLFVYKNIPTLLLFKGLPVLFEPDSKVKCVDIEIVDDNYVEDDEKFKITLVTTEMLVKVARVADMAVVTIVNDDERKLVSHWPRCGEVSSIFSLPLSLSLSSLCLRLSML